MTGKAGKSFIEVLEEQIRADLRKEITAELRQQFEAQDRGWPPGPGVGDPTRPPASRESDDIRRSLQAENVETWLLSHVEKLTFPRSLRARQGYRTQRRTSETGMDHPAARSSKMPSSVSSKAVPLAAEPTWEPRRIEDLCRVELLRRHGARIGGAFTATELKTAWRRAALATHPDRFSQAPHETQIRMGAIFRELTEAYVALSKNFGAPGDSAEAARAA